MTLNQISKPAVPTVPAGSRVLIVNDHRALAELLSSALEAAGMRVLGFAHSAAQAVTVSQDLQPDVVVLDIEMAGQDGLAATRRLREVAPNSAVAVLTDHREPDWMIHAAQAGAAGVFSKDSPLAEVIDMLSGLRAWQMLRPGRMLIAPSLFSGDSIPASGEQTDVVGPRLTRRELELLGCLGQGMQVKSIARSLGISVNTCRTYVKSLHFKLDAGTNLQAVVKAHRLGLLASVHE